MIKFIKTKRANYIGCNKYGGGHIAIRINESDDKCKEIAKRLDDASNWGFGGFADEVMDGYFKTLIY